MKKIVLGVSGGIAAYKSAVLCRLLIKAGYEVRVVMTQHATQFISAMTFQALTGWPVLIDDFAAHTSNAMSHIELARFAEAIIIAPATANTIARLAHGLAEDALSSTVLASQARVWIAPAMNQQMWKHAATQANIQLLRNRATQILGPDSGDQACGDVGLGRMLEPEAIMMELTRSFGSQSSFLAKQRILITAGATREAIDPIRYLSNRSTGKMGFALAHAAKALGAEVTLVSGPTTLQATAGVNLIEVTSALEMYDAVHTNIHEQDIFIAAAAVSDYRPINCSDQKIKKSDAPMTLVFERNPDILASVAALENKPFCVGFAAETDHLIEHAKQKLVNKKLDAIIANQVEPDNAFESDFNAVTMIDKAGNKQVLERDSKQRIAVEILRLIDALRQD